MNRRGFIGSLIGMAGIVALGSLPETKSKLPDKKLNETLDALTVLSPFIMEDCSLAGRFNEEVEVSVKTFDEVVPANISFTGRMISCDDTKVWNDWSLST